jgi:hypothetical protein
MLLVSIMIGQSVGHEVQGTPLGLILGGLSTLRVPADVLIVAFASTVSYCTYGTSAGATLYMYATVHASDLILASDMFVRVSGRGLLAGLAYSTAEQVDLSVDLSSLEERSCVARLRISM